jgi:chromate transporter
MREDIVVKKSWVSEEDFEHFLGYTQIAPGPMAFQMSCHIGYHLKKIPGAFLAGFGMVFPSFLLVLLLSILYIQFGELNYIRYALYGVNPIIIAIILSSGLKLGKSVFKKDFVMYLIFFAVIAIYLILKVHLLILIFASGFFAIASYSILEHRNENLNSVFPLLTFPLFFKNVSFLDLAYVFLKTGALTYGSGFVIVGVLQQEIVDIHKWLTLPQFIDGIAFGQITPGPVVMTSTFIGFMTSGIWGAIISTVCIFIPTFFFVIVIAKWLKRYRNNFYFRSFIKGANAAAIGAILSTAVVLAKGSLFDIPTIILFVASICLLFFTKVHSLYLIISSALLGILIKVFIV